MRVRLLHAENILTFDELDLSLGGSPHTIVGPNGAGKSNIVRLLGLVPSALRWAVEGGHGTVVAREARRVMESFAAAKHHGSPPGRPSVVRLGVEFNSPDEREHLVTFMRAAILCTLRDETGRSEPNGLVLSAWVEEGITEDSLAPLFAGTLVLRHSGMAHLPWDVGYELVHEGVSYEWQLWSRQVTHGIVRTADLGTSAPLMQRQLKGQLLKLPDTWQQHQPLPGDLPPFDFASLCPVEGESITPFMIRLGTGSFDAELRPFRRSCEVLGIPAGPSVGQYVFSLPSALAGLLDEKIMILGEQFRGLGAGGGEPDHAGPYDWETLVAPTRNRLSALLPLRLFELKNGGVGDRARFQAVQALFQRLAPGRSFDVTFEPLDLAQLNPGAADAGVVNVFQVSDVQVGSNSQPGAAITVVVDRSSAKQGHPGGLPVQLHGGGTWESLVIAEELVESRDRLVILDEPALTLHPTWQRALRDHLREAPGSLLVVTHSANLVPVGTAEDLGRLTRVENETGSTRLHRFPATLVPERAEAIVREFSLSTDAVAMLFARGVVFVEGQTELGALPRWFVEAAAEANLPSPADLDLAFYSVGGDAHFKTLVQVAHVLAIPWVLVCDGAAFDIEKKWSTHIFRQVLEAGVPDRALRAYLRPFEKNKALRKMDLAIFEGGKALGWRHGVMMVAPGWRTRDKRLPDDRGDESFEAYIESVFPRIIDKATDAVGESKVRRGIWIAEHAGCPEDVARLYKQAVTILRRRGIATDPLPTRLLARSRLGSRWATASLPRQL